MPIKLSENKTNQSQQDKIQFQSTKSQYSFKDLILEERTINELMTVVEAHNCWKTVFDVWGLGQVLHNRKNLMVNLFGAPGTGKTMAAHAIADALGKEMICVNYAEIESKYVGETSKNLTSLFQNQENINKIIFFDEADALLSKRVVDMSSANDVSVNQTRSVLLTLLNQYDGMVVFATNFISNYDPAFMRRIQYHIEFRLPNEELRERLWRMYIPIQMPIQADLHELAVRYGGLSGSDISNAVLKAALAAAKRKSETVDQDDFIQAVLSIQNSINAVQGMGETVTTEIITEDRVPSDILSKSLGSKK